MPPHAIISLPPSQTFALAALGLPADAPGAVEQELIARVKRILNVFLVQGAGLGELLFAACSRKGMAEEKVLVTILSDR